MFFRSQLMTIEGAKCFLKAICDLFQVIANIHLDRFAWRHDSVLNFLAKSDFKQKRM